jgi:hypothetical protein
MPNKVVCRKYRRKCALDIGQLLSNIEKVIFFNIFSSPEWFIAWRWYAMLALRNFAQCVRSAEVWLEVEKFGRSSEVCRFPLESSIHTLASLMQMFLCFSVRFIMSLILLLDGKSFLHLNTYRSSWYRTFQIAAVGLMRKTPDMIHRFKPHFFWHMEVDL